ncbi:hypothetical protein M0R45_030886 [Rubus argutus]|uniref:Uncharacterized protein n=1 Tax=Rubus argutus TaxID=59490 RepID=A0AAW1WEY8_RUBAR
MHLKPSHQAHTATATAPPSLSRRLTTRSRLVLRHKPVTRPRQPTARCLHLSRNNLSARPQPQSPIRSDAPSPLLTDVAAIPDFKPSFPNYGAATVAAHDLFPEPLLNTPPPSSLRVFSAAAMNAQP